MCFERLCVVFSFNILGLVVVSKEVQIVAYIEPSLWSTCRQEKTELDGQIVWVFRQERLSSECKLFSPQRRDNTSNA